MARAEHKLDMEQHQLLERRKELELVHANRMQGRLHGALTLRHLRTLARRLWGPVERPAPIALEPQAPGTIAIMLVGHATFQLVTHGARILTDPFLCERVLGQRRRIAATIAEADLDRTSAVLLSHAAVDRLDTRSLSRLPRRAELFVPVGLGARLRPLGFAHVHELCPEDVVEHNDVSITATAARHPGAAGAGTLGYVVREMGAAVFFAGATGYFSGLPDLGRRQRPDVALLPITGYQPLALRAYNLSPLDALYACEDLRARILVPYGFDAFTLGYEPDGEPLDWLRAAHAERVTGSAAAATTRASLCVLHPGQLLRVERKPEL